MAKPLTQKQPVQVIAIPEKNKGEITLFANISPKIISGLRKDEKLKIEWKFRNAKSKNGKTVTLEHDFTEDLEVILHVFKTLNKQWKVSRKYKKSDLSQPGSSDQFKFSVKNQKGLGPFQSTIKNMTKTEIFKKFYWVIDGKIIENSNKVLNLDIDKKGKRQIQLLGVTSKGIGVMSSSKEIEMLGRKDNINIQYEITGPRRGRPGEGSVFDVLPAHVYFNAQKTRVKDFSGFTGIWKIRGKKIPGLWARHLYLEEGDFEEEIQITDSNGLIETKKIKVTINLDRCKKDLKSIQCAYFPNHPSNFISPEKKPLVLKLRKRLPMNIPSSKQVEGGLWANLLIPEFGVSIDLSNHSRVDGDRIIINTSEVKDFWIHPMQPRQIKILLSDNKGNIYRAITEEFFHAFGSVSIEGIPKNSFVSVENNRTGYFRYFNKVDNFNINLNNLPGGQYKVETKTNDFEATKYFLTDENTKQATVIVSRGSNLSSGSRENQNSKDGIKKRNYKVALTTEELSTFIASEKEVIKKKNEKVKKTPLENDEAEDIVLLKRPKEVVNALVRHQLDTVDAVGRLIDLKCPDQTVQVDTKSWNNHSSQCCRESDLEKSQMRTKKTYFGLLVENGRGFECHKDGPKLKLSVNGNTLISYQEYKSNRLDGKFIHFYSNDLSLSGNYKNSLRHGVWEDGRSTKITYDNGKILTFESCSGGTCSKEVFKKNGNIQSGGEETHYLIGDTKPGLGGGVYHPSKVVYSSAGNDGFPIGLVGNERTQINYLPSNCPIEISKWEPTLSKDSLWDGIDLAVYDFLPKKNGEISGRCKIKISQKCNLFGWVQCEKEDSETYLNHLKSGLFLKEYGWNEIYREILGKKIDLSKKIGKEAEDYRFGLVDLKTVKGDKWGRFKIAPPYTSIDEVEIKELFWIKLYNEFGEPNFEPRGH